MTNGVVRYNQRYIVMTDKVNKKMGFFDKATASSYLSPSGNARSSQHMCDCANMQGPTAE